MKKRTLLFAYLLLGSLLYAQAPQMISYQAVIRNSNNNLVVNSTIGMKISILQGSNSGPAVYEEIQTPVSNDNGLVSIEIGNGTVLSGDFSAIDWSDGPYFIQTEVDPSGSTNYTITACSELLSVPYALYAEKSNATNCSSCDTHFVNANADDTINGDLTVDNLIYSAPHVYNAYVTDVDFTARSGDAIVNIGSGNGGAYIANKISYGMSASVEIPSNAVVTDVEIYYYDKDTTSDLRIYFWKHMLAGGYILIGNVMEQSSAGAGVIRLSSGLPATYTSGTKYEFLVISVDSEGKMVPWPGFTLRIKGIKVTYELNKAL